jgi:hypothetical protein
LRASLQATTDSLRAAAMPAFEATKMTKIDIAAVEVARRNRSRLEHALEQRVD